MVTDQDRLVAGRYRLSEQIGRGGMGTVWLAEDQLLDRLVAVKKLHVPPQLPDDEQAKLYERTRREARSAARISHNCVTVVHDVVEDQGLPCIVMEYVRSRALSHVVREDGPLTPQEAARVGLAMTGALLAAHRAGVLHRDVKPANVLLSEDGQRIVLTDFGIAAASGTATLTRTGEFIGSVNYSSPERVQGGESGEPGDAWALGGTLYEAVEGVPPFRRDTWMETAFAIATDPPRPMERAGPLRPLIEGLLTKDPQERTTLAGAQEWLAEAAHTLALPPPGVPDAGSTTAPTLAHPAAPFTGAGGGVPGADAAERADADGDTRREGAAGTSGVPGAAPAAAAAPPAGPASAAASPPAPRPSPRRPRGPRLLGAVCAVLGVGAIAVGTVWFIAHGRPDGGTRTEPPAHTRAPHGPGKPPPTPEGYKRIEDRLGFSVDVPEGWRRSVAGDGQEVNYVSPSGMTDLKFSVLDFAEDSPVRHWRQLEPDVRGKSPGYHRMRLNATKYQGRPAAIWEWRWQGKARAFHAIDLGFGEEGRKSYAVYLSAPDADWGVAKKNFDVAVRSYRVTGD